MSASTPEFQSPAFRKIDTAAAGDTSLVAAVAGKKIRVISYNLVSTSANTVKFRSATTDLTGGMALPANGQADAEFSPIGHFETAVNEPLNINLSGATQVSGHLAYVLIS